MVHRYEDALFAQTELLRLLQSGIGVRLIEGFERGMRVKEYDGDRFGELPEGMIYQVTRSTLEGADPIYVAPQIMDMLEYAMPSFNPEPVVATDLFCAQGFAMFPRPLVIPDVHDEQIPVRAIAWMPVRASAESGMGEGGLWMSYFTHRDDDEAGGRLTSEQAKLLRTIPHGQMTLAHSWFMPYGANAWDAIESEKHREVCMWQWRIAQVLWRLGSQVIRSVRVAPRWARKDARRHGLDRDNVTVIQLRKESHAVVDGRMPELPESEGEHYSVQFVVRGHWRSQWYPSIGQHRQIWISPHLKGPEWAPLKVTKRVFELVR